MPWSCAAGIRCVETSPFVVAPQTKNVPARARTCAGEPRPEPCERRAKGRGRGRRLLPAGIGSVRPGSDLSGSVPHERDDEREDKAERGDRHKERGVAPVEASDPGQERQKDELPRGVARREDPGNEAPPGHEPAVSDDRRERH